MPNLTFRSRIDVSAEALFAWHERPGAFMRLVPPWANVTLRSFEGIRDGARAVLRLELGPLHRTWVAEHFDVVEGRQFCDVQVSGPFASWKHAHRMIPDGPSASILEDDIEYRLPLGPLGRLVGGGPARRQIERQFAYRHRVTRHDLRRHEGTKPLRIAVTGASGLIGRELVPFLTTGGHEVLRLVRRPPHEPEEVQWDPAERRVDRERLEGLDAVLHLAGEPVLAARWSEARKMAIYASRVRGTAFLAETLAGLEAPPSVLVSASGVGWYGDRGDEVLTEESTPGERGFLTAVARDWEAAVRPADDAGIRTVTARMGAVLTPRGGALALLQPFFAAGLGGVYGDPDQYLSWITPDDLFGALLRLVTDERLCGPVNLTTPEPVPMRTFARTLGRVLSRPTFVRIPAGAIRRAFGEMAEEAMLNSTRARPARLQDAGFDFEYPSLEGALRHVLGR